MVVNIHNNYNCSIEKWGSGFEPIICLIRLKNRQDLDIHRSTPPLSLSCPLMEASLRETFLDEDRPLLAI